jgi:hypothetical protein
LQPVTEALRLITAASRKAFLDAVAEAIEAIKARST